MRHPFPELAKGRGRGLRTGEIPLPPAPLLREEGALALNAPAVATGVAIFPHDAMAGNGEGDMVGGTGLCDGAGGGRLADGAGNLAV